METLARRESADVVASRANDGHLEGARASASAQLRDDNVWMDEYRRAAARRCVSSSSELAPVIFARAELCAAVP
jgi:hypothetical protein